MKNNDNLEAEIEKKILKKEQRKRPKMKVSGKSVFQIRKKIIKNK